MAELAKFRQISASLPKAEQAPIWARLRLREPEKFHALPCGCAENAQTAWSDDDAFPEMRRSFDNATDMVFAAKPPFRRKP
jgi:hypothetical protein